MLSRTADHLFWMARYMERAENTARMLDVNYQTSLLPQSADTALAGRSGLLSTSELTWAYQQQHRQIDARNVMDFMVRDEGNLSSIWNCLRAARRHETMLDALVASLTMKSMTSRASTSLCFCE